MKTLTLHLQYESGQAEKLISERDANPQGLFPNVFHVNPTTIGPKLVTPTKFEDLLMGQPKINLRAQSGQSMAGKRKKMQKQEGKRKKNRPTPFSKIKSENHSPTKSFGQQSTTARPPLPPNPTPMDMVREEINMKLDKFTTPKTFLKLLTTAQPLRPTTFQSFSPSITTKRTPGRIDSMREQIKLDSMTTPKTFSRLLASSSEKTHFSPTTEETERTPGPIDNMREQIRTDARTTPRSFSKLLTTVSPTSTFGGFGAPRPTMNKPMPKKPRRKRPQRVMKRPTSPPIRKSVTSHPNNVKGGSGRLSFLERDDEGTENGFFICPLKLGGIYFGTILRHRPTQLKVSK
jgi:hypothetical protein